MKRKNKGGKHQMKTAKSLGALYIYIYIYRYFYKRKTIQEEIA